MDVALGRAEPLNVQRVMDALYQSAETGQLVETTD